MSQEYSLELPKSTSTVTCYTNVGYSQVSYDEYGPNFLFRTDSNTTIPSQHEAEEFDERPGLCRTYCNLHENGEWTYWRVTDNGKYIYHPIWIDDVNRDKYNLLEEAENRWIELLKEERENQQPFESIAGRKLSLHTELRNCRYDMGFVL